MSDLHVSLVFVSSLDGKLTRGEDPNVHAWSSAEDWENFKALRTKSDVIVMDRLSYEAVRPTPEPGRLRIVFTRHPDLYHTLAVPGQLEFVQVTPEQLMQRLKREGFKRVLLASGGNLSSEFLKAGLVDDLYLTLEPLLFGKGTAMLPDALFEIQLTLKSVRRLNERGSLLLHYVIQK